MKTITLLVFTVIFNACGSSKEVATALETDNNDMVTKVAQTNQDNPMTIEYTSVTRGTYKMVKVNSKTVAFKNTRTEEPTTKDCTSDDWSGLMKHTEAFKVEDLNTFEPPSKAHQYDGAPIANLKITIGDKVYQTLAFDHGKPPKEIADLVNAVLKMAETGRIKGN